MSQGSASPSDSVPQEPGRQPRAPQVPHGQLTPLLKYKEADKHKGIPLRCENNVLFLPQQKGKVFLR